MEAILKKVIGAMLAIQRHPWEQGYCAQAMFDIGETETAVAMAHEAVLRQAEDGRLAMLYEDPVITDPAVNGEPVLRAYEITRDAYYFEAAQRMLDYLLYKAPKTDDGIMYAFNVSFYEGFSAKQIQADACYMAPPFIAMIRAEASKNK